MHLFLSLFSSPRLSFPSPSDSYATAAPLRHTLTFQGTHTAAQMGCMVSFRQMNRQIFTFPDCLSSTLDPSIPPPNSFLCTPPCHIHLFFHCCRFSAFVCPSGLAFILSRGPLTGICFANTLAYTCTYFEYMVKRMAVFTWEVICTCMHVWRASANKELIIVLKTMARFMKLNSTN